MIIDKLNEVLNRTESHTTMHTFCAFIKAHVNEIAHMSIEEVAKECYMSKGQVSKCAKNLGFSSYIEFKDSCVDYSHSILDKPMFFSKDEDLPHNIQNFGNNISHSMIYVGEKLNYSHLSHLINDIIKSERVYLYAQGDNRSLCYILQTELSIYHISTTICDTDFTKDYDFDENSLLIILSTNGTIFNLYKRTIARIEEAPVRTWLLTCNPHVSFNKNLLVIPSYDIRCNKFAIRYIVDIIISYIHFTFKQ